MAGELRGVVGKKGQSSFGEVALVFIGGRFSHAARKSAVLQPNEEAPLREDEIGAAEVMYESTLVAPSTPTDRQIELATAAITYLQDHFDVAPLYARVDVVFGADGHPLLLELEAVEPNLFLRYSEGAADQLATELTAR